MTTVYRLAYRTGATHTVVEGVTEATGAATEPVATPEVAPSATEALNGPQNADLPIEDHRKAVAALVLAAYREEITGRTK